MCKRKGTLDSLVELCLPRVTLSSAPAQGLASQPEAHDHCGSLDTSHCCDLRSGQEPGPLGSHSGVGGGQLEGQLLLCMVGHPLISNAAWVAPWSHTPLPTVLAHPSSDVLPQTLRLLL